jgi:hypothetical protein
MSVSREPGPVGPHDPTHFSPRRREDPEPRASAVDASRALLEERFETAGRRTSGPAPVDSELEDAVYESLRRPLDVQARTRAGGLAGEIKRSGIFGVAGRTMAAIFVSAIIALFFVIMMPGPRQPDGAQLLQSFSTALSQPHQSEDAPKPALAEFHSLLAPSDIAQAAERDQPGVESDQSLRQFLLWRLKAASSEAAQQPPRSEQVTNR